MGDWTWVALAIGVVGTALAGWSLSRVSQTQRELQELIVRHRATETELATLKAAHAALDQRTATLPVPRLPDRYQNLTPFVNTLVSSPGRSPWATIALMGYHGVMAYWNQRAAVRPKRPRSEK